jgi:hypothetical protein
MKRFTIVAALMLAPTALLAQSAGSAQAKAHANAQADAHANAHAAMNAEIPPSFSASARGQLQATYARAQEHHLPEAAISHRVAEGQAKGASETAIVAAAGKVEANMEAAQAAMTKAGHTPTSAEIESGANAMDRGVSVSQIATMAAHAPAGRSLNVAFNVLTKLSENGMPVDNALAQVQAKLDANASDAAISALAKGRGSARAGGGL